MLRTHTCGELTAKNIGEAVTLFGWVDSVRDHGGLTFLDLRDRYGKTQIVASEICKSRTFKSEDCIGVKGKVQRRPKGTENPKIVTGEVEIVAETCVDHSGSAPLPFEVTKSRQTNEELRLKYRYLDLRNPEVQRNLFARHKIYQVIRNALSMKNFIEVETPILTKSTPEGARDYLVPSRLNAGEFYALPQSPQLFKQILMVSGFDRYFQIARCFRDEDLRADRQPEFTQLDMEMSFIEENDLFGIIEEVVTAIVGAIHELPLRKPFPRLTYQEAVARYGTDKPDLRFGLEIQDISDLVRRSEFKIFREALGKKDGIVAGICVPKTETSRKDIESLIEFAKSEGAAGLADFKAIAKFFDATVQQSVLQAFKASEGDLILIVADERAKALKILGVLRLYVARWKNLIPQNQFHFSWVTDFPLFKYNDEEKRWESEHHPFTSPHLEDWKKYYNTGDLGKIRSRAYDLVLNGNEIASGSIRIHQKELQREIFKAIGLDEAEAQSRFGFLLKAFEFGAPPHGGIALGIDRVVAILLGLESIREVIAFPKNQKAADPMTDAPSPVGEKQLKELGIKIR